jgi:transcriptional regulator with XRE-family HTH domain
MNNLKSLREQAGLTQQQVFDLLKIPIQSLRNWEREKRKPTEFTIKTLTEFYQKTINKKED